MLYGDCGEPSETGPGIDPGVSRRRSSAGRPGSTRAPRGTAQPFRPDPGGVAVVLLATGTGLAAVAQVVPLGQARGSIGPHMPRRLRRPRSQHRPRRRPAGAPVVTTAPVQTTSTVPVAPVPVADEHHRHLSSADVRAGSRRGRLRLIAFDLNRLPGWTVVFLPGRVGYPGPRGAPRTEANRIYAGRGTPRSWLRRPRPRAFSRPRGGRDVLHACASELDRSIGGIQADAAMVRLRRLLRLRHSGRRLRGDLRLHGDGPGLQLAIRARPSTPRTSRSQR